MKLRLTCQQVSRLISEGLDRDLDVPTRTQMRLHFAMCETCRNVSAQMAFLRRAIRQLGQEPGDAAGGGAQHPPQDPPA